MKGEWYAMIRKILVLCLVLCFVLLSACGKTGGAVKNNKNGQIPEVPDKTDKPPECDVARASIRN